jgi:hypothetical protein
VHSKQDYTTLHNRGINKSAKQTRSLLHYTLYYYNRELKLEWTINKICSTVHYILVYDYNREHSLEGKTVKIYTW